MENDFLSAFLQQVALDMLPVLAALAAAALIALAKKLWAEAKAAYPQATDQLEWAASMAVKAAEQAGGVTLATEKKDYAVRFVSDWLLSKGLKIDVALIDAAVEAAVWDEFKSPEAKALAAKVK